MANDQGLVDTPKLSRRDFLKLAGLGLGAYVANRAGRYFLPQPFEVVIYGPDYNKISYAVPPELENLDIPKTNENRKSAWKVVMEGLKVYEQWRLQDPNLPLITYIKPPNYLSSPEAAEKILKQIGNGGMSEPQVIVSRIKWSIPDVLTLNDQAYSTFADFSWSDIDSIADEGSYLETLIRLDPGSGFVAEIRSYFLEHFGPDADPYRVQTEGKITAEMVEIATTLVRARFEGAKSWIDKVRGDNRCSTGLLLPYFLIQNKGALEQSLWDTVIYLKLVARSDLKTLRHNPSQEGAKLLGQQFIDEFSSSIPFEWLMDNLPQGGKSDLWTEHAAGPYVDFMPIGRSGEYYHVWNIIALASCVSPNIVPLIVRAYHAELSETNPHGRVKIRADVETAQEALYLSTMYNDFSK